MKKFLAILSVVAALAFMISDFFGHEVKVSHLWARPSDEAGMTMTYMTIDNEGSGQDTLTAVQSDAAEHVAFQEEVEKDGKQTVSEVKALDIPGGQIRVLKPKGAYIVLSRMKNRLVKGDTFPITMVFEKRGIVEDKVVVEDAAATDFVVGH